MNTAARTTFPLSAHSKAIPASLDEMFAFLKKQTGVASNVRREEE